MPFLKSLSSKNLSVNIESILPPYPIEYVAHDRTFQIDGTSEISFNDGENSVVTDQFTDVNGVVDPEPHIWMAATNYSDVAKTEFQVVRISDGQVKIRKTWPGTGAYLIYPNCVGPTKFIVIKNNTPRIVYILDHAGTTLASFDPSVVSSGRTLNVIYHVWLNESQNTVYTLAGDSNSSELLVYEWDYSGIEQNETVVSNDQGTLLHSPRSFRVDPNLKKLWISGYKGTFPQYNQILAYDYINRTTQTVAYEETTNVDPPGGLTANTGYLWKGFAVSPDSTWIYTLWVRLGTSSVIWIRAYKTTDNWATPIASLETPDWESPFTTRDSGDNLVAHFGGVIFSKQYHVIYSSTTDNGLIWAWDFDSENVLRTTDAYELLGSRPDLPGSNGYSAMPAFTPAISESTQQIVYNGNDDNKGWQYMYGANGNNSYDAGYYYTIKVPAPSLIGYVPPEPASLDYWIGSWDSGIDGAWYDSINNKIHISEGNTIAPKVVTMDMEGTIEAEKTGSYGNNIYEEFNNPNTFYEDQWYIATAHNGTGAAKTQYPFNSTTTYYTTLTSGSAGYPIYPTGNCEVAVTGPQDTNEVIHTIAGSQAANANTNEVYYSLKKPTSSGLLTYKVEYSGYVRNYSYGCAASWYQNKIGICSGLSSTGSGPYPASFLALTFDQTLATPSVNSVGNGAKVVSNAANNWAYNMNLMSWPTNTRWLHAIRCDNGENTHILVSWDYNTNIKDQIAFDLTKGRYIGAVFKNSGNSATSGPYIIMMKDEVVANRYYFVNWDNDDNNTSNNGGSNTGGIWNSGSNAVQIDFLNGTYGQNNGKGKGYMIDDYAFVLGVDIGPSGTGVVFKLPADLSLINDTSNSEFTITTGAAVNAAVDAMVDMTLQKTFSSVGVNITEVGSSSTSTGVTLSSASWVNENWIDGVDYTQVAGQKIFTTTGTHTWYPPPGVTSVSVVAIGGGGGDSISTDTYASSGGGLGYKNNISVTPGQSYTLQVGQRGGGGTGITATDSWFINDTTVKGGAGANTSANGGGDFVGDGGGNGGHGGSKSGSYFGGGGGAGGYSGNGGNGGSGASSWTSLSDTATEAGKAGTGGAAGGGHAGGGNGGTAQRGSSGGGTGILGEGTSGAASVSYGVVYNGSQFTGSGSFGAGALQSNGTNSYSGSNGAVRIIWPGNERQFPSTRTQDE